MNVVPRIGTPIGENAAATALVKAFHTLFGRDPTKRVLVAVLSLVWVETARGGAVKNNNLGNISAAPSFSGNAWRPPWFDFDGGQEKVMTERNLHLHEEMLKGRAPSAFRAYDNADAGALDLVRQLRGTFPEVLDAAETGDPNRFREALAQKYSKDYADPAATESFRQFFEDFDRKITAPPGTVEVGGRELKIAPLLVGFGIAATAAVIAWATLRVTPAPARARAAKAA